MGKSALTDGRVIYVSGEISESMQDCRKEMRELALDDKAADITLVITSRGGVVHGANAILDEMDAIRQQWPGIRFCGYVEGLAASAAVTILQGCDRRIAGAHSVLMVHGASGGMFGDVNDSIAFERFRAIVHDHMARLYARRSTLTAGEWLDLFRSATPQWHSAREALALGLIDEITGS